MNSVHGTCLEDVHALRVVVAVAQSLSFTRAGEVLGLTQSAVSHQIARLERELDARLFERDGRSIRVTSVGEALVRQARRAFELFDEMGATLRDIAKPGLGRLRIGAPVTLCQFFLPDVLREFRECFPQYALSIVPGDAPDIQQRLNDGSIDVGLLLRPESSVGRRYAITDLFHDQLGLVTHPLHRWATSGSLKLEEVERESFILYARSSMTFAIVESHFARLRRPIRDSIELGSIEAIKELVKLGLGVSVLAPWVMTRELSEGSLHWQKLPGPPLRRSWVIAAPKREASLAEQTFIELCRAVGREVAKAHPITVAAKTPRA
ncbi:MAG: LysR family transcriptional regulator [Tepidisphaeraceae bacterium]